MNLIFDEEEIKRFSEEKTMNLCQYKKYWVCEEIYLPIEIVNLDKIIVEDKCSCSDKESICICIKAYQDGYLTIINFIFINGQVVTQIDTVNYVHTPEILLELQEKQQKSIAMKKNLVSLLQSRGHKLLGYKRKYRDISLDLYDEEYDIYTEITTDFCIPANKTFQEGYQILQNEKEYLKKYKPQTYGCLCYEEEFVTKMFEFRFSETKQEFV